MTKGGGFRALQELKAAGDIKGFGLGVNEWEVIRDALEEIDRFAFYDRAGILCKARPLRGGPEVAWPAPHVAGA